MQLPDAPLGALLPWWFNELEMRRLVSSDGQVYVSDGAGGELRVEPAVTFCLYQVASGQARGGVPQWCDPSRVVRHLLWEYRRCPDCGHEEKVAHFAWDLRRCPICWSRSVEVRETRMGPPLPPSFRAVGDLPEGYATAKLSRLEHEWGLSAAGDARQLYILLRVFRRVGLGHSWLFLLSLFADTLLTLHGRDDAIVDRYNLVLNAGNVHQSLFRTTGLPAAGAAALNAFQAAAAMDENAVMRSMALHSFGMAVIFILDVYDEGEAERMTARPAVRAEALAALREALRLVDQAAEVDPKGAEKQRLRIQYALGDLLRRGDATPGQLTEAEQVLGELDLDETDRLGVPVRAALLETRLAMWPGPDEDLDRWVQAAGDLTRQIRSPGADKLGHRWHWALAIGQFLLRMGEPDQAQPYLESAVTFIMKDTGFETDPAALLDDAERFSQAFTLLAAVSVNGGEPYEALALVETFRGRVLQMAGLTPGERRGLASEDELARLERFPGLGGLGPEESPALQLASEGLSGTPFGPFEEDYDLPGLENRVAELEGALLDERTALVSLSLTEQTVQSGAWAFAVILHPPGSPDPRIGSALWRVDDDLLTALRSDSYRRPGSFREPRLRTLSGQLWESLLAPLASQLRDSSRLLLALPGPFGNVPIEIAATRQADQPVRHMSVTPALTFGPRPLRRRNRVQERLLVIGYSGDDLPEHGRRGRRTAEAVPRGGKPVGWG